VATRYFCSTSKVFDMEHSLLMTEERAGGNDLSRKRLRRVRYNLNQRCYKALA